MKKQLVVVFTFAAAALTFAGPARAKEEFPPMVGGYLQLDYTPPCRLCHLDGKTAQGTLRTPFALSMRERGFDGSSDQNLLETVDKLKNERVDSDGDGTPDTEEMKLRNDPNSPAKGALLTEENPDAGCGIGGRGSSAWAILGFALVVLVRRARARRTIDG